MWEITIETMQNAHYITSLNEKLKQFLKQSDALVAVGKNGQSISIGCEKNKGSEVWNMIKKVLCDVFCGDIKHDFLKNRITNPNLTENQMRAFLSVLTYFDSELERQIVFRALTYNRIIVLEGFLNFKLSSLKQKWKELCVLASDNAELLKDENFLEIMRFFVNSIEPKNDCVVVSCCAPCVVFNNKESHVLSADGFDKSDIFSLVAFLITLAPNKVKLFVDNFDSKALEIVREIFSNRVEIIR